MRGISCFGKCGCPCSQRSASVLLGSGTCIVKTLLSCLRRWHIVAPITCNALMWVQWKMTLAMLAQMVQAGMWGEGRLAGDSMPQSGEGRCGMRCMRPLLR